MRSKHVFMAGVAVLAASAMAIAAPSGGTISGRVTYTGTPAKQKPIDMSKEPSCAKQYTTPPVSETVVTGEGNSLHNVVVYISAGAPDGASAPAQAVTFAQKGCRYIPHVAVLQVNQELKVVNDDQTSHNIHPLAKLNREWNKSQPPGSPAITEKFEKEEFIPVKCNIHPWMHGTFAVLKTTHYAVTADNGGFTLPNLPPGKYTITAWHESYGTQTQDVTITGSETKSVDFVFKAKAY
jgi:plastocyanin